MSRKISRLSEMNQKRAIRLGISVAKDPFFRRTGRSVRIISTSRTKEEQREYVRKGASMTMDSYHLLRLAVDYVIAEKFYTRVLRVFWSDYTAWRRFGELAVDAGFRSFNITHNWDHGHVEAPQVFQGQAKHCYAFVIINMLQMHLSHWRMKTKEECYILANSISLYMESENYYVDGRVGQFPKTVEGAISATNSIGLYLSKKTIHPKTKEDWKALNGKPVIISQKRKAMGSDRAERWRKHRVNIENERGIFNHTATLGFADERGILLINSHKEFPEYRIRYDNIEDSVRAVYLLSF